MSNGGARLRGKTALVTGAAVGLGRAIATRFAEEGASVIMADTKAAEGKKLADELRRRGKEARFVRADISKESEVETLFETALAHYGRIDVLYNNAAVLLYDRDSTADELTLDAWDCVMNVN